MKPFSKFLLMMMVVVMAACSNNGQAPRNGQASDDKYTYDYVKKISVTQPKKALQLLRTAEERKMMPDLDINVLRGIVYYNSMFDYKKAKTYTEAALRDPAINKQPARLLETLDLAARIDYNLNHYASCLRLAERGVDEAYKYDDRRLVAKFLTLLGQCHCETGDPTHAISSFDRAIAILNNENKNSHEWKNYYNLVTAYALKANTLLDMKQYAQLFDMRTDYEEALSKLNALPETINGVNDISNATFYSIYAIGYELSGKHDMGNEMYDKLCNTRSASTPEGATFLVPYLMLRNQHAEALKKENEMEALWRKNGMDTVNYNYTNTILMNKARTLHALGRYKEASETAIRAYGLRDSVGNRARSEDAAWMAEQLGKDILKKYVNRQDKILKVSSITTTVFATLMAVCLFFMLWAFRANKKLKAKDKATSGLVKDLLTYKELFINNLNQNENAGEGEATVEETTNGENEPGYQEFLRMEKAVIDNRLFVRPKLERTDVANELGTSVAKINDLFSTYCKQSFNNYINDLRMEYAAKLLKEKPDYTIEAIGAECGVPIRQTFHRLFAKKFGMTPAEYRKNLTEE